MLYCKVVRQLQTGELVSARYNFIPREYSVEYKIGEFAYPQNKNSLLYVFGMYSYDGFWMDRLVREINKRIPKCHPIELWKCDVLETNMVYRTPNGRGMRSKSTEKSDLDLYWSSSYENKLKIGDNLLMPWVYQVEAVKLTERVKF